MSEPITSDELGDSVFVVEGLTINELSAEKVLGWCSKDLPKHLVHLAYVARSRSKEVDHDRVAELVREKFAIEGASGRYRRLGVGSTSDLPARFRDPERLQALLHRDWPRLSQDEPYFVQAERNEAADQQLLDSMNVERLATDFWAPTLAQL